VEFRPHEAMLHRDVILALVLLAFAGLYWVGANGIVELRMDSGVGAQTLPKGLAYALATLSLLLLAQSVLARRFASSALDDPEHAEFVKSNHPRAFGILVIGGVYLIILSFVGYVVGLIMLMGATALYMGRTPSWRLATIVAGGAVFYWLLFVKLLRVPLPEGVLGGLATLF
jgi:hypothetical protein